MNLLSLVSSWAVIIYLSLGFFIIKIDPKAKLNRLFLLWTVSLAEYSLCYSFLYGTPAAGSYQFWDKLSSLGWGLHISILFHVILLFIKGNHPIKKGWFLVLYGPGIWVILFETFLAAAARKGAPQFYHANWIFEGVYIYVYASVIIFRVWNWGRHSPLAREQKQARIFSIAGMITFTLCFINEQSFFPALPVLSPITLIILAGAFCYAVRRYKLPGLVSLLKMKDVVDKVTDLVFLLDNQGRIVDYNYRVAETLAYSKEELLTSPLSRIMGEKAGDVLAQVQHCEFCSMESGVSCNGKSGARIPVRLQASAIIETAGDRVGTMLVCQDQTIIVTLQSEICNRKRKEEQLKYIGLHDSVTGLFNRTRFEQELKKYEKMTGLSVGVVVCDIDGLKMVNDTLGHNAGDQLLIASARVLQSSFRRDELIARIGGDEFAVLIPDANRPLIKDAYQVIQNAVERFNRENPGLHLSLSVGYAVADSEWKNIIELFKEADNYMYKEKLTNNKSVRNGIMQALTKTLEARDFITEGHTSRIQEMMVELGNHMRLSDTLITNLRLLGQFHDIGKIGTPDRILFKPGRLTEPEMNIMRQHSDIGYRIAKSIPDLNPIADLIRLHHERWDGGGYPAGFRAEKIPLECRILAVVDAYDAIINNRPYRKAQSEAEAIAELKRNAGSQFDPAVVAQFLTLLADKKAMASMV